MEGRMEGGGERHDVFVRKYVWGGGRERGREEGRERGREVDMLAVIVQFYISRLSPPFLSPSLTSSLSAPLPNKDLWQQGNQCFLVLGVSIIHQGGLLLARPISGGHG